MRVAPDEGKYDFYVDNEFIASMPAQFPPGENHSANARVEIYGYSNE